MFTHLRRTVNRATEGNELRTRPEAQRASEVGLRTALAHGTTA